MLRVIEIVLSESFGQTLLHDVQTLFGDEIEPLGVQIGTQIVVAHRMGIKG